MPEQDVPLHRVRGLVSGANWRATKFTTALPPHLTCGLCRGISPTTFLLPCFHTLCESCVGHSVNGGNAVCPFDEQSFAVGDCPKFPLPPDTAEKLNACCWNESQGCTFVGTLQAILTHFEEECTFHAVKCPRCHDLVLHEDLPRHYRAGCLSELNANAPEWPAVHQGVMISAVDIATCLDELKALIRDPYQDQLPVLQSKLNEVLEEARNIGYQVEAVTRAFSDSENRLSQALQELSTTFGQQLRSQISELPAQPKNTSEAARNDDSEVGTAIANELPWRLEKRHILRKLELVAADLHTSLEVLRQRPDEERKQSFFSGHPTDFIVHMLPSMCGLETREECCVVSLANIYNLLKPKKVVGLFTRWYRRDKYLQVAVEGVGTAYLSFYLKWGDTLQGSCSMSQEARLSLRHPGYPEKRDVDVLKSSGVRSTAAVLGFHDEFFVQKQLLDMLGMVKGGRLTLVISFKG